MGIRNLIPALKAFCPEVLKNVTSLDAFIGKVFAIEVSGFMHRFSKHAEDDEEIFFDRFLQQWKRLTSKNITTIYVFDGIPPVEKDEELERRRTIDNNLEQDIKKDELVINKLIQLYSPIEDGDTIIDEDVTSYPSIPPNEDHIVDPTLNRKEGLALLSNMMAKYEKKKKRRRNVRSHHYHALKDLFRKHEVPFIDGFCDGEKTCSMLCRLGYADVVVTDDTDSLPFGSPITIWNLDSYSKPTLQVDLSHVLSSMKMDMSTFVDFCILCGCDYKGGKIRGIGWKTARDLLLKHKTIESFIQSKDSIRYRKNLKDCDFSKPRSIFSTSQQELDSLQKIIDDHLPFLRDRRKVEL